MITTPRPFLVAMLVLASAPRVHAQLELETNGVLPATTSGADYKMTLKPGRYSATVRSSSFRPVLELADSTDNVLIVRGSDGNALPATVEMRFLVSRAEVFALRVRSQTASGNDSRFHLVLIQMAESSPPAAVAVPGTEPVDSTPAERTAAPGDEPQQVLDLVNKERRKMGLTPLRMNAKLSQAAQRHSANMARQNTGAHELDGVGPGERIKEAGYRPLQWGENIAWGAQTPEQAMHGWMNSPGHRRNILSSDVSEIGIGVAESSNGVRYWTQVFGRSFE